MKVTIENKKGLNKDLKVFIDKKTISSYMDEKYEEVKNTVSLKGFRPGKVPKEILKNQFGKAIFSEVLDKVLKDTSTKALQENKIKPAGQPKIDLKTYGEDKDLEYVISVTELPKIDIQSLQRSCLVDGNAGDPSIETFMHAFLPHKFIAHSHANAVLSVTNQSGGTAIAEQIYKNSTNYKIKRIKCRFLLGRRILLQSSNI